MEIPKIIHNNINIRYLILFILLIGFCCEYSFADLNMQALSPFNNYHKQDRWLTLNIALTNTSGEFDGEVSVQNHNLYSMPISVFRDTRKSSFLYIHPNNIQKNVNIRLKDKQDKIISEKELSLYILNSEDRLIAIIDSNNQNLTFSSNQSIENTSEKIYSTNINVESLPDQWKGYDLIDAVILGNISPNVLSKDQEKALVDWICSGGILIVSGGANSQSLKGTFVEKLLPVKIFETHVVNSLPSLSNKFGDELPKLPIVIAKSKLIEDSNIIISEDDGTPIISEIKIGSGKCIFLCFDYSDPIFKSWNGNNDLWKSLIFNPNKNASIKYENISRLISNQVHLSLPSYKIIGGFILAYILCLSVPSYIISKRSERKEFVWILIILVTFIFIFGSLGLSYSIKKRAYIVDFSVVEIYKGFNRAKITSYFCPLFAENNINIAFNNAIFVKELVPDNIYGKFSLSQGDNYRLKLSNIRSFSSQFLYGELITDFKGNIRLEKTVDKAKIINDTDIGLIDCLLINNDHYALIKNFNPLSRNNIELNSYSGDIFDVYLIGDEKKAKFFNTVKPSLYGKIANGALIGWIDGSALDKFTRINADKSFNLSGIALVIINL